MAQIVTPFTPVGPTQNGTITGSSQTISVQAYGASQPYGSRTIRVWNNATSPVFIEFGISATVAAVAATSYPVPPGAVEFFDVGSGSTTIAYIGTASSGTIYVTEGQGN